jgi:Domain of unknown function (DUF929)
MAKIKYGNFHIIIICGLMARMKDLIKKLKIAVILLVVVIGALAVYILYPLVKSSIQGQPFGKRLTGVNSQLTTYQLASINNLSDKNFEIAGEMLLNLSIPGEQNNNNTYVAPLFQASLIQPVQKNPLIIDGKPSVVYIGATSCIYCGENRWAMALALSRFGSFDKLYIGYSSLGDGDVPTLYWSPQNITTTGKVTYGNYYNSNYINFFSAEYDSPISSGFQFPVAQNPIQYFVANSTDPNYAMAMEFMNSTHLFQGTPFTFWGTSLDIGADAVVFGNSTSQSAVSNYPPITYMTHQQIFDELRNFRSTFAYEEYAAADIYIAQVCPSINNSAPICSLPAIKTMESKMKLT